MRSRRRMTLADEIAEDRRRPRLGLWARFAVTVAGIGGFVGLLVLAARQPAMSDYAQGLAMFWIFAFGWMRWIRT